MSSVIGDSSLPSFTPPPFPVRRFTIAEYEEMTRQGILTEDSNVELLQGWIVYVDRNSSTRNVAMFNRVGQRAPAHLTGCGKAALCYLPFDKVVAHVEKCCAESSVRVPNMEELENELKVGRQNGYITSQSFQRDRLSVAAAIFDSSGHPLGGISVAGPASMFTPAVLAAARASVTDAAGLISARIINAVPPWLAGSR